MLKHNLFDAEGYQLIVSKYKSDVETLLSQWDALCMDDPADRSFLTGKLTGLFKNLIQNYVEPPNA